MRVIALNIEMLLLYSLRRHLRRLRHHRSHLVFVLHHVVVPCLLFFLLWCTDYLLQFRVTIGVRNSLHVLLHSDMRGGILSCGLHLLDDIPYFAVLR